MVTKEHLHAEVDTLFNDDDIAKVYAFILHIKHVQFQPSQPLLQRLKQIHIQAPHDFAVQHDAYASGGAYGDPDIR